MPIKIQATYNQGQDIIVDVTLTAHHKGHVVFSACPIVKGEIASQACFDKYKLKFIEDMAWNANFDPNYPERAYLAPIKNPGYVLNPSSSVSVMDFSFKVSICYCSNSKIDTASLALTFHFSFEDETTT